MSRPGLPSATKQRTTSVQIGPGFFTLLGIVFLTLKLTGHIDWDWWLVLLPLWIGPAIVLSILLCLGVFVAGFWACVGFAALWRRATK